MFAISLITLLQDLSNTIYKNIIYFSKVISHSRNITLYINLSQKQINEHSLLLILYLNTKVT